ncbi:PHP domain-containing protein [Nitrospinaceae bacterium]|nr:PHP domain-containing protein [Nitrospinaceae bacterium]
MKKFEIHMHSTFSDGEFSPTRLVDIARRNGVSVLCLTDHDTFEGITEFMAAAKREEISAFPGIEITVRYRGFNLHLLAYFESIESLSDELSHEVTKMASKRERRMRELIYRVNEVIPEKFRGTIEYENVRRAAEGVLARPHLAKEMVRLGVVPSTRDAFDRYLVKYNVERENLGMENACKLIRECNGIPVLAHPGERSYSLCNPAKGRPYEDAPEMVEELKSFGLLGMECVYPYHERTGKVEYYKDLSQKFGLIITGSRDFHGSSTYQSEHLLGATKMDTRFLEQFKEVWAA